MARNEIYRKVLKTAYSKWHRSLHHGIAYTDIDKISQCPACGTPLLIGDTIFNKDNTFKTKAFYTKTAYLIISKALKIPYFEIYYTTVGQQDHTPLESLSVRLNYPKKGELKHLTLQQWQLYLEHKVIEHAPTCKRKDYLQERINKQDHYNKSILLKSEYDKVLLNRS